MSSDVKTLLEALAYQREHADANWEDAGRVGRRCLILTALAAQLDASTIATTKLAANERARYVSSYLLAAEVAAKLGLSGARRLGRGAMGGHSWTGYMSPALRVTPALASLAKHGLVVTMYEPLVRTRLLYRVTQSGLDYLAERTP